MQFAIFQEKKKKVRPPKGSVAQWTARWTSRWRIVVIQRLWVRVPPESAYFLKKKHFKTSHQTASGLVLDKQLNEQRGLQITTNYIM